MKNKKILFIVLVILSMIGNISHAAPKMVSQDVNGNILDPSILRGRFYGNFDGTNFNITTMYVTNLYMLKSNSYTGLDSNGKLFGTVDGGNWTNIISTNIVYSMLTFSPSTNSLILNNSYYLLQTATDCAVTNVIGQSSLIPTWATLWISNSSVSDISFYWTAAGNSSVNGTNRLVITAGKMGVVSVFRFGTAFTNYNNTTFK